MAHRLDIVAQQVIGAEQVARIKVTEYKYTMDGEHTGYLYLQDGKPNKCMWLSQKTKLYTSWHGDWFMVGKKVWAEFDCLGDLK